MEDDIQDVGEPIAELRDLSVETEPDLYDRVRRRIERRSLASSFMDMAWLMPILIFIELVGMVFGSFGGSGKRGESVDDLTVRFFNEGQYAFALGAHAVLLGLVGFQLLPEGSRPAAAAGLSLRPAGRRGRP